MSEFRHCPHTFPGRQNQTGVNSHIGCHRRWRDHWGNASATLGRSYIPSLKLEPLQCVGCP
jgi:hypothetical protein